MGVKFLHGSRRDLLRVIPLMEALKQRVQTSYTVADALQALLPVRPLYIWLVEQDEPVDLIGYAIGHKMDQDARTLFIAQIYAPKNGLALLNFIEEDARRMGFRRMLGITMTKANEKWFNEKFGTRYAGSVVEKVLGE